MFLHFGVWCLGLGIFYLGEVAALGTMTFDDDD
jgi:hypothetical protein